MPTPNTLPTATELAAAAELELAAGEWIMLDCECDGCRTGKATIVANEPRWREALVQLGEWYFADVTDLNDTMRERLAQVRAMLEP